MAGVGWVKPTKTSFVRSGGFHPPYESRKVRGGHRKPGSVGTRTGRRCARFESRMIIYLGRRLPGASSDLPGSHDGSGRSVSGGRCERSAWVGPVALRRTVSALPPYLVLLPMGFAEPGRSPGLLVSSYLAVSPLPRSRRREAPRPRRFVLCGTVPIRSAGADPDGGRYPPSRPVEPGLSSVARPRNRADAPVGLPPGPAARAQAPRRSSRPP